MLELKRQTSSYRCLSLLVFGGNGCVLALEACGFWRRAHGPKTVLNYTIKMIRQREREDNNICHSNRISVVFMRTALYGYVYTASL